MVTDICEEVKYKIIMHVNLFGAQPEDGSTSSRNMSLL